MKKKSRIEDIDIKLETSTYFKKLQKCRFIYCCFFFILNFVQIKQIYYTGLSVLSAEYGFKGKWLKTLNKHI